MEPVHKLEEGLLKIRRACLARDPELVQEACPVSCEAGVAAQEQGRDLGSIPKEYWDLREIFSEKGLAELPLHQPMDCYRYFTRD